MPKAIALFLLFPALLASPAAAQVLRVDADAPPGGDGSSWSSAIDDLQLALAAALPGTEIWVAGGRYRPSASDPTVGFFLPDGVLVFGGFAGTETRRDQRDPAGNPTVLDGDLNGDDLPGFGNYADNALHVVQAGGGRRAHLDGFTVRGGRYGGGGGLSIQAAEVALANLVVAENQGTGGRNEGGGAWLRGGTIAVSDCTFADNRATGGAGLLLRDVAQALVSRCSFERNDATGGAGIAVEGRNGIVKIADCAFRDGTATDGGGILVAAEVFGELSVERCTFERNEVTTGAGLNVAGDVPGFVSVADCVFRDNSATAGGGIVLYAELVIDARVSRCLFERNDVCAGGGLYLYGATVEVLDCEFRENHRPSFCGIGAGGGAIRAETGMVTVHIARSLFLDSDHCLLWGERSANLTAVLSTFVNADVESPAIRLVGATSLELDSCIVWGAADEQVDIGPRAVASAVHSDVHMGGAGLPGAGNLDLDPAFVDLAAGDLHLAAHSPCIDAGNPALVQAASDLDRDSRLLDGDLDGRVVVDMGVDEHGPLHLEILGLPAPGSTLTFVTTGPPGLQAFLLLSTPGLHHLPAVGTLFLDTGSPLLRSLPWTDPPSRVSLVVPPGIAGLYHFQELALDGSVRLLSNYVPLQF